MLTAGHLSSALDEVLSNGTPDGGPSRVLLDMADVTFCDSQGLGTLVVLSRKAASARAVLVLTNVTEFLMRVLDITGLRTALMVRNDPADGARVTAGGGVSHGGTKPDRPEWVPQPPSPRPRDPGREPNHDGATPRPHT